MSLMAIPLALALSCGGAHGEAVDPDQKKIQGAEASNLPAPTQEDAAFRALGWAMWASVAADLASTEIGLQNPNLEEAHPLFQHRAARVAGAVGIAWVSNWASSEMYKINPKAGKIMRAALVGFRVYIVGRNVHLMYKVEW